MDKDTEIVAATLQAGYGDATQTVLDHKVARAVINAMREAGWFSPSEVALIVDAAGGTVTVSDDAVDQVWRNPDEAPALYRERLPYGFSTRLSVR